MPGGIVISESEPLKDNRYVWFKPSVRQWYELNSEGTAWALSHDEPALSLEGHSHPTHGDIDFTGTVKADGDEGLTGQRTIGGHTLTFKKGLLVGYQ